MFGPGSTTCGGRALHPMVDRTDYGKPCGRRRRGGLVTGWGVLGFGLTLSLQQTAKDLFSTLQLFLTRPYDVGDLIDAGQGHRGWVVTVGWRFTTVKLLSNAQHCAIPNVALADTRIQNFSRIQEGGRRGDIELRVALDTPVEVLRRIPGWLRSCATDAGLKVVWSLMTDVTTHGHNFKAIVTGPADAVEFDSCKQEALFALLEVLSEHSVALPSVTTPRLSRSSSQARKRSRDCNIYLVCKGL